MLVFRRGYKHGIHIRMGNNFVVVCGMNVCACLLRKRLCFRRIGIRYSEKIDRRMHCSNSRPQRSDAA